MPRSKDSVTRSKPRCRVPARRMRPARADFSMRSGKTPSNAQGAIGLVLDAPALGSLLVDNLNATIHLRALLTDLFLIDQAR